MDSEALAAFKGRYPVIRDIPVAWGDMDAYGHVNNIMYLRYFETARIALFEKAGIGVDVRPEGVGPILAATECRFRVPVAYPDTVTAAAWIDDLTDDGFLMGYAVFSHAHDRVAAEGSGRIVAYDYAIGRKATLDSELRRRLAVLVPGD